MKRGKKSFLTGFFSTLSVLILLCGFAVADRNTRLVGFRDGMPAAEIWKTEPLHYRVRLLGEEMELSFAWLNTAAKYGQAVFDFLPPGFRVAARLAGRL